MKLNPALQQMPVYQPGRPIEEVARELNLDPASIIKLASNENPSAPPPGRRRPAKQPGRLNSTRMATPFT